MNLRSAYEPFFKIGVAISRWDVNTPSHLELVKEQFNSLTCENDMKPMYCLDQAKLSQNPQLYQLAPAVTFEHIRPYLDFARDNHIPMRGHTLVWHNQTPPWFFHENYDMKAPLASRETMLARMESYIQSVLTFTQTEYPGLFYAWDVVNEIVNEGDFRKSLWTETVGTDFFLHAFRFARKYAAPGVQLFYNDYETSQEWKRDFILKHVLQPLMAEGLVDGMGLQSHLMMDHPDFEVYRTALEMYGATGLIIHLTELDMHNADPSDASMKALANRYAALFTLLIEAKKAHQANIECVTFWNLLDEGSWLTFFRQEKSHPLLFHGDCEPKEAYYAVLDVAKKA